MILLMNDLRLTIGAMLKSIFILESLAKLSRPIILARLMGCNHKRFVDFKVFLCILAVS